MKKIIFVLMILVFIFGCTKDNESSKPCRSARYSFNITGAISPQKESYKIGDTITFETSISKILFDFISNQSVDYSRAISVLGHSSYRKLDSIQKNSNPGMNYFDIHLVKGNKISDSYTTNAGFSFELANEETFKFKIKIIPIQKGLFSIIFDDFGCQGIKGINCTNAYFPITLSNSNRNLNIFFNVFGYYPDALSSNSLYCFRVQ